MTDQKRSARQVAGLILCRGVVPLWVLIGAVFKLAEANPALLPKNTVLSLGHSLGLDLDIWLASLIGLELLAVSVMILVARFARPMAIFMLASFCLILIGEMTQGASSCGCLGANSPSPLTMLLVDATLLVAVVVLSPGRTTSSATWPLPAAAGLTIAGFVVSFLLITGGSAPDGGNPVAVVGNGNGNGGGGETDVPPPPVDPLVNADLQPVPNYWFKGEDEFAAWVGQPWRNVELFSFMPQFPDGLDEGTRYVVFYRRSCDHCQEMFQDDLASNPDLARQVVGIEIPESKEVLTPPNAWEMPDTPATLMALPLGANWIITPPLALRIEDGIVQCVKEGDHHECFGLESDHEH